MNVKLIINSLKEHHIWGNKVRAVFVCHNPPYSHVDNFAWPKIYLVKIFFGFMKKKLVKKKFKFIDVLFLLK